MYKRQVLGDWIEAIAILIIVVLNGVLGYTQESRAEQSMEALKRMAVPIVRVRRDGQLREVSAREVVPGDVVILETGNIVPADGRVLSSANPVSYTHLTSVRPNSISPVLS